MRAADEEDGSIAGDVECPSRSGGLAGQSAVEGSRLRHKDLPDLSEEDVDDDTPENENQVICRRSSAWVECGVMMGQDIQARPAAMALSDNAVFLSLDC